jgi:hypothetical protein
MVSCATAWAATEVAPFRQASTGGMRLPRDAAGRRIWFTRTFGENSRDVATERPPRTDTRHPRGDRTMFLATPWAHSSARGGCGRRGRDAAVDQRRDIRQRPRDAPAGRHAPAARLPAPPRYHTRGLPTVAIPLPSATTPPPGIMIARRAEGQARSAAGKRAQPSAWRCWSTCRLWRASRGRPSLSNRRAGVRIFTHAGTSSSRAPRTDRQPRSQVITLRDQPRARASTADPHLPDSL